MELNVNNWKGCVIRKSSIMSLLLRYYEPESGDIFVDGMNVKDLNIRWLRNQFGKRILGYTLHI